MLRSTGSAFTRFWGAAARPGHESGQRRVSAVPTTFPSVSLKWWAPFALPTLRLPGLTGRVKQNPVFTVIYRVQFRFIFNLKRHPYLHRFR